MTPTTSAQPRQDLDDFRLDNNSDQHWQNERSGIHIPTGTGLTGTEYIDFDGVGDWDPSGNDNAVPPDRGLGEVAVNQEELLQFRQWQQQQQHQRVEQQRQQRFEQQQQRRLERQQQQQQGGNNGASAQQASNPLPVRDQPPHIQPSSSSSRLHSSSSSSRVQSSGFFGQPAVPSLSARTSYDLENDSISTVRGQPVQANQPVSAQSIGDSQHVGNTVATQVVHRSSSDEVALRYLDIVSKSLDKFGSIPPEVQGILDRIMPEIPDFKPKRASSPAAKGRSHSSDSSSSSSGSDRNRRDRRDRRRRDGKAKRRDRSTSRDAKPVPKLDIFLSSPSVSLMDCYLDMASDYPSRYNPFYRAATLHKKAQMPVVSHISLLEKRSGWNDWNNAVVVLLEELNLSGFFLDLPDLPSSTVPWKRPVPRQAINRISSDEDRVAYHMWGQLDAIARHVIVTRLGREVYRETESLLLSSYAEPTSYAWYTALRNRYGRYDYESGGVAWKRAEELVCGANVGIYLSNYRRLVQDVHDSVYPVAPTKMITTFLRNLPSSLRYVHDTFRAEFTSTSCTASTPQRLPDFKDVLLWIERAEKANNLEMSESVGHRRPAAHPGRSGGPPPPQPKSSATPNFVGAATPSAVKAPGARLAGQACFECGKVGHQKAQCPTRQGDRARAGAPLAPKGYLAEGGVEDDDEGSVAAAEEMLGEENQQDDDEFAGMLEDWDAIKLYDIHSPGSPNAFALSSYFGSGPCDSPFAGMAIVPSPSSSRSFGPPRPPPPLPTPPARPSALARRYLAAVDSGCSQHIVIDRSWFHSFRTLDMTVGTANSTPLVVLGCGTVKFPVRLTDGSTRLVVLQDVLFAPTCPINLLSVGHLTDFLGLRLLFGERRTIAWFHTPGEKATSYLSMSRQNHLTYLKCDFIPAPMRRLRGLRRGDVAGGEGRFDVVVEDDDGGTGGGEDVGEFSRESGPVGVRTRQSTQVQGGAASRPSVLGGGEPGSELLQPESRQPRRSSRLQQLEHARCVVIEEEDDRDMFFRGAEPLGDEYGAILMTVVEAEAFVTQILASDYSTDDLDPEVLAYFANVGAHRMFDDEYHSYLSRVGRRRDIDGTEGGACAFATYDPARPPETLREAMRREDWPKWRAAMTMFL
ncbi:hypothetical protein D9611_014624 [Ephemerocybe angulata]|uniref:CCHC-type domain-containing protein n=1 Tax=Ephemerocybe angulata TaxID=980116 RepID=A0A8H5CBX0_9AGAR|nr:hypothetical protein D9611_014624 [Tulosesus angulatus]